MSFNDDQPVIRKEIVGTIFSYTITFMYCNRINKKNEKKIAKKFSDLQSIDEGRFEKLSSWTLKEECSMTTLDSQDSSSKMISTHSKMHIT